MSVLESQQLDYDSFRVNRTPPPGTVIGIVACGVGAIAIIVPLISLFPMLTVASGTEIRPMAQAMYMVIGSAAGVLLVLPMSFVASGIARWRREALRWPLLSFVVAIASIVLVPSMFITLLKIRHLTLAP